MKIPYNGNISGNEYEIVLTKICCLKSYTWFCISRFVCYYLKKLLFDGLRLLVLAILLVWVSCTGSTSSSAKQNTQSMNPVLDIHLPDTKTDEVCKASDIADTVMYVSLETNEKSLLGYLWCIAMNESYIVVSDKERIMAFQSDGKFIGQIGSKGKGPGEFTYIWNILLNGDTIYVSSLDKPGISRFTIDGKYLGFINHPFWMEYFRQMKGGGYAGYNYDTGSIVYFNNKWQVTDTLAVDRNVTKYRQMYSANGHSFNRYLALSKDRLLFNNYMNDTIWDISSKKKQPSIIIHHKGKLLPDRLQGEYVRDMDENLLKEKLKPFVAIDFMQTDSFIFFSQYDYMCLNKPLFFVYNKGTRDIVQYKNAKIYEDYLGNIELPIFFYYDQDHTIVSEIDYQDMKKEYEKATSPKVKDFWSEKLARAKENDNVTLVIMKIN